MAGGKSNEITATLQLLELHGCVVTIDAMGCQREIAQQITQGGVNYPLAVKQNQGQLREGIRDLFEGAEALGFVGAPYDYKQTTDKGHTDGWNGANVGASSIQTTGTIWTPRAMAATEGRRPGGGPASNPRGRSQATPLLHQ